MIRRTMPLLMATLLAGCFPASVEMSFDGDKDGLLDAQEWEAGSDPTVPDSDGDGWLDGEEWEQSTDPTNPEDHPYTGEWGIDSCRDSISSTGNDVGQIATNFEAVDQFGDVVKLHDFCGRAVVLVSGAFW